MNLIHSLEVSAVTPDPIGAPATVPPQNLVRLPKTLPTTSGAPNAVSLAFFSSTPADTMDVELWVVDPGQVGTLLKPTATTRFFLMSAATTVPANTVVYATAIAPAGLAYVRITSLAIFPTPSGVDLLVGSEVL